MYLLLFAQTLMSVQRTNTSAPTIATTLSAPTRAAAMLGMPSTLMGEDVMVSYTMEKGGVKREAIEFRKTS